MHSALNQSGYIFLAVLFLVLNGFFVAAEFALVKIRSTRLEVLVKKGNPLALLAQKMVDRLDPYLSACQLGITLASLGLGWIGEPAFSVVIEKAFQTFHLSLHPDTLHSLAFTLAFVAISALHIVIGELVPKSIAIQTAEKVVLVVALPLQAFYKISFPFLWILNLLSNAVLRILRFQTVSESTEAPSEEEIKLIVEDSFEEGNLAPRKHILLDKALDFSHKKVSSIMIPKNQMVCFYLEDSFEKSLDQARESDHTRFPLLVRETEQVLGFVHMKDVIWVLEHGELINFFDLRRPLLYFNQDLPLDMALIEFQKQKIHIAIVRDSSQKILGLVTLEDVIEQLVGKIDDEFDQE